MHSEPRNRTKESVADLLVKLRAQHRKLLDLCVRLENLADSLPDNVDIRECLVLSQQVYPVVRDAHHFEEEYLFPLLVNCMNREPAIFQILERMQFEHWEDESAAEDLSFALQQLICEPASANVEKISYMLRGFFDGMRRHVAFEADHLLPMLTMPLPKDPPVADAN